MIHTILDIFEVYRHIIISIGTGLFVVKAESVCYEEKKKLSTKFILIIDKFSIKCRKTKTKVITLANHKGRKQSIDPIKCKAIT